MNASWSELIYAATDVVNYELLPNAAGEKHSPVIILKYTVTEV